MLERHELLERVCGYDPYADRAMLGRAYDFAMKAHGSQKRASGEPYFSHPAQVAGILSEYRLDTASIVTGLLHDTVEDTGTTVAEVRERFGDQVARLVDGVTKLSKLELRPNASGQAENFRKLLLAMSKDVRVLLVKLADRLHNMRTLRHVASGEKRDRIARETMDIYVPLAGGIGIQDIKEELEDLAFEQLHPDMCEAISGHLATLRRQGGDLVDRVTGQVGQLLADADIDAWVSGRMKRPVSIWRKMQNKHLPLEHLTDIVAFRVVVASVEDCYRVLGRIHLEYRVLPGEFDDYISTPKPNGYQSLHTAVIGPGQRPIEIQIRTTEMHQVAEFGVAAHWQYKLGTDLIEGKRFPWVDRLLDILENAENPEDFIKETRLEIYEDRVFCFTPTGQIITLPRGATPVDFAYAVHSEIGDRCIGARINGKMMPLRTRLGNGDQVEILTIEGGAPSPAWERWVATGKARARIRRHVRNERRGEFVRLGTAMLDRAFRISTGGPACDIADRVLAQFRTESADSLAEAVGRGDIPAEKVVAAAVPSALLGDAASGGAGENGAAAIPIRGLRPGVAVHHSECCDPMPGEQIMGILIPGRGISIHTRDCETLTSFAETPERWVDVAWDLGPAAPARHTGRLDLVVANRRGALGALTTLIAQENGNITNLKITSRARDFFQMLIDVEVEEARQVNDIVAALRTAAAVSSVDLRED